MCWCEEVFLPSSYMQQPICTHTPSIASQAPLIVSFLRYSITVSRIGHQDGRGEVKVNPRVEPAKRRDAAPSHVQRVLSVGWQAGI